MKVEGYFISKNQENVVKMSVTVTSSDDSGSEMTPCARTVKPKKRRKNIRTTDVMKMLRLSSHSIGADCKCSRLQCFKEVPEEARRWVIRQFNEMSSHDEQSSYLSGLITIKPIKQRRSRKDPTLLTSAQNMNTHSYSYKVRFVMDNVTVEKPVCYKAFLAIHGITNKRVENIKKALSEQGKCKPDMRGKHQNHANHLPEEFKQAVMNHIAGFKGRKSHYSVKDSQRTYLPEDLNVKKMHKMFEEENPSIKVSYDTYRLIFLTNFNISFGYPRTDTCSFCDEMKAKISNLEKVISETAENSEKKSELQQLNMELKLHHLRADKFYELKRKARIKAKNEPTFEAFAFDYQKNLPLPNVSTNDAYYCRQLSFYLFNIHQLSTRSSYFYMYDETRAKKGADDVVSMLHNFITHFISAEVRMVTFFCDSCSGQNKNYTMFRYLYYLVHIMKRFDCVSIVFPIRGHSYMECDKNMALINQKTACELPSDWVSVVERARSNPEPFHVIDCQPYMFENFSKLFKDYFAVKCPFPSRPGRQLRVTKRAPNQILVKSDHYTGRYDSYVCVRRSRREQPLPDISNIIKLYPNLLPISKAKFDDLQCLKRFCTSLEAQQFYSYLTFI